MAKHAIFITGFMKGAKITDEYWYSYLAEDGKGILRVYKHEELLFEDEANIGDGFILVLKSKTAYVEPIILPEKLEELVAWLLGFDKRERAPSYEEYTYLLEQRRSICNTPGYVEETIAGPNYELAKYSLISDESCQYHPLACWVDPEIGKMEILHLIPRFIYPKPFVKKVLSERLSVSSEDLKKALAV